MSIFVCRGLRMKSTYTIAIAVILLVIVIGSVVAYTQLNQPAASPSPSPTQTATVTPSASHSPTATPIATPGPATLQGSGATFPLPFINASIVYYTQNVRTNVQINYPGGGSGKGITDLTNKQVDFAGSDAPLNANQTAAAPGVLHIPETIGAVTIAYNLPSIPAGLNLTGEVIAKIYLGTITKWNDAAIQTLNPSITLPNEDIVTVHRSEGSGTTNIFTKYLSNASTTWATTVGASTTVQWPAGGIGQQGNAAVASTVNSTQYSIGYVELNYALKNHMTVAAIKNPSGNFVLPTLDSTTVAVQASAAQGLPAGSQSWSSVSLLNANNASAYPIVSFTYILVYKDLSGVYGSSMTQDKATQLVQYIWWLVHDGQSLAPNLQYATLPANVVAIDEASIQSITFNGQTLPVS
jgi:phosphate transport system substrate-binding protein